MPTEIALFLCRITVETRSFGFFFFFAFFASQQLKITFQTPS